ncbi:MAG: hypothetical protein AAFU72_16445 [Pseudomonadota bacterium]
MREILGLVSRQPTVSPTGIAYYRPRGLADMLREIMQPVPGTPALRRRR